jgi:ribose 5-phosphate isomerase B
MSKKLRIIIGADDAGTEYKNALKALLEADERVELVIDMSLREKDDRFYPAIAVAAAQRIAVGEADRALLVCGTGLGMAIAANKVAGIRAVTAHDGYSVERSVLSNNAQVLCMGQRVIGLELAKHLVKIWLSLSFDKESASAAKVAQITDYENGSLLLDAETTQCD